MARSLAALRAQPYEDLGFARVDHHRSLRQGFPEVVLGLGKTPAQIAAIAAEIVSRGSTLLVTRATADAFEAVRTKVPAATFYDDAAIISCPQQDVARGKGTIVVAAAGTSDLPVAEEAARTAELMGNEVVRLYDVGVAGLHRILGERTRLASARVVIVVAGMEGALPSVISGSGQRPGDRRADERGLRGQLRRDRCAARHAQQLLVRGFGGQHRQWLRRGQYRQPDQSLVAVASRPAAELCAGGDERSRHGTHRCVQMSSDSGSCRAVVTD